MTPSTGPRIAEVTRKTAETQITAKVNPDGTCKASRTTANAIDGSMLN